MPVFKIWPEGQPEQMDHIRAVDHVEAASEFFSAEFNDDTLPQLMETREREEDNFWEAYTIWVFMPLTTFYGQPRVFVSSELGKIKPRSEDPRLFNQFPEDEFTEPKGE